MRTKTTVCCDFLENTVASSQGSAAELYRTAKEGYYAYVFGYFIDGGPQIECLLECFARKHSNDEILSWARGVQGSFAVLLVDTNTPKVVCITDRTNSRKLFFRRSGNEVKVFDLLQTEKVPIDMGGLGSYLANSGTFGHRTILQAVNVVPRASVQVFGQGPDSSFRYWDVEFDASYAKRSQARLIDEFYSVLEEACLKNVPADKPIGLLTSAGYDSSFLLGILAKERKSRLTAISYSLDQHLRQGFDAYTAKAMADMLGVTFRLIKSYEGDLQQTLRNSAKYTQCLTFFHESDAYAALSADPHCFYVTGDECLGWGNFSVRTREEAGNAIGFFDGSALASYASVFLPEALAPMIAESRSIRDEVLAGAPDYEDLHDLKDWLYLDQRENFFILGSRAFGLGNNLSLPFLDQKVIEFVAKLPSSDRVGKTLFKKVAIKAFPEIFALPRAYTGGGAPDWKSELINKRNDLLDWIRGTHSAVDEVLLPEAWETLFSMLMLPPAPPSVKQKMVGAIRSSKWGNVLLSAAPKISSLGPRFLHDYTKAAQISPVMLLMKLLIARHLTLKDA